MGAGDATGAGAGRDDTGDADGVGALYVGGGTGAIAGGEDSAGTREVGGAEVLRLPDPALWTPELETDGDAEIPDVLVEAREVATFGGGNFGGRAGLCRVAAPRLCEAFGLDTFGLDRLDWGAGGRIGGAVAPAGGACAIVARVLVRAGGFRAVVGSQFTTPTVARAIAGTLTTSAAPFLDGRSR